MAGLDVLQGRRDGTHATGRPRLDAGMSEVDLINRLVVECGTKGWDSYDADPVTEEVAARAVQALNALRPDYAFVVVPLNDGGIGFEGIGLWDGVDLKVEP
jgi:hypothetical protein